MRYEELDEVVLNKDLAEHGLRKGDLGTVVMVYAPDGIEVEFVRVSGQTQALVALRLDDVRPVGDEDLAAMRTPDDYD